MAVIDSLFVALGIQVDQKKIDTFLESIEKLKKGLVANVKLMKNLAAAVFGVVSAMSVLFMRISQAALADSRLARTLDISRDRLEAFNRAGQELTGNRGIAQQWIESLKGMTDAMKAGRYPSNEILEALYRMGLNVAELKNMKPDEILLAMAGGFQELDKDSQDAVSSLMNFDSSARNLLLGLNQEIVDRNRPFGLDLDAIEKIDQAFIKLKNTFSDAIMALGAPFTSALLEVLEGITQIAPTVVNLMGLVARKFIEIVQAAGELAAWFVIEHPKIVQFFEDLMPYILNSLNVLRGWTTDFIEIIVRIFSKLTQFVSNVIETIANSVNSITDVFETIWNFISETIDKIQNSISSIKEKIKDMLPGSGFISRVSNFFSGSEKEAAASIATTNSSIDNSRRNETRRVEINQQNEINITAENPQEAGRILQDTMKDSSRFLVRDFNPGVL